MLDIFISYNRADKQFLKRLNYTGMAQLTASVNRHLNIARQTSLSSLSRIAVQQPVAGDRPNRDRRWMIVAVGLVIVIAVVGFVVWGTTHPSVVTPTQAAFRSSPTPRTFLSAASDSGTPSIPIVANTGSPTKTQTLTYTLTATGTATFTATALTSPVTITIGGLGAHILSAPSANGSILDTVYNVTLPAIAVSEDGHFFLVVYQGHTGWLPFGLSTINGDTGILSVSTEVFPTLTPTLTPLFSDTPRPTYTPRPTATSVPFGTILFSDDFEDGNISSWGARSLTAKIIRENGNNILLLTGKGSLALLQTLTSPDYALEVRMKIIYGGGNLSIDDNITAGTGVAGYLGLSATFQGKPEGHGQWATPAQDPKQWHVYRLQAIRGHIEYYIDGKLIPPAINNINIPLGGVSINVGTEVEIDDVKVVNLAGDNLVFTTVNVSSSTTNVWTEPRRTSPIVANIVQGQILRVTGKDSTGSWLQVQLLSSTPPKTAWIPVENVNRQVDLSTVPIVS